MKFMKLGSKSDAFQSDGSNVRLVVSELATDVVVHVGEVRFYLHKFPLLSKSKRLQRLILKASEDSIDEVLLHDFPGGPKSFEICAKFCYGMILILNAYNVVAARCAAEYLEMTEDVEKGNLIFKIEVFLNSSIFRSWKDSIIVLQTTKSLVPWSEELKVVGRCVDSIASKTSVDPARVNWSYTYSKKLAASDETVEPQQTKHTVPKDWWIEDLCELDVDLYKRVMVAVKSKGRMSSDAIGEALKAYAVRWLPDSHDALVADDYTKRNRTLVESIIWLLPSDKGSGCSCRFLLKLLKVVILVGAGDLLKEELMKRISVQLHKASVNDLLIPAKPLGGTTYDVGLVQSLVSRFMMQVGSTHNIDFVEKTENRMHEIDLEHKSLLTLGKLIDCYLAEIASDPNLSVSSFIELSMSVPEAARPIHDGLYTAIDIYLKSQASRDETGANSALDNQIVQRAPNLALILVVKCMEHPRLAKAEKKKICGLMEAKKLSADACMHAAQNDRLPLRVVVQVLFFEQMRAAAGGRTASTNNTLHGRTRFRANVEEDWNRPLPESLNSVKKQLENLKVKEDECRSNERKKSSRDSKDEGGGLLLPSRSRRIFDRFWVGKGHGENKSSETSGSSQSPPTTVKPGKANKFSGSSSRKGRYSVS